MILDGFGINENEQGNAVKLANTPNIDKLMKTCPTTRIFASGMSVGLPEGQMGNSEVGHTNIGAGRIVYQELTKITKSIEDGDFFSIPEFNKAIENCKKYNSKLHIMGLLSDGGVHSHNGHIYGLLELAKRQGLEKVYVHCFLDGRDTPPASGNYRRLPGSDLSGSLPPSCSTAPVLPAWSAKTALSCCILITQISRSAL